MKLWKRTATLLGIAYLMWVLGASAAALAAAPTVTSISPNNGPEAGGTSVTVTGTGFISGSKAKFGNTAATAVTVKSSESLTATSPAGSAGEPVNVTVTNSNGTSASVAKDQFAYDPLPMGLWLGVTSNSSYHYLGTTGDFTAHNIMYDRNGHIEWEVGESGESLTKANEDLERSIEAGMLPDITIEYAGYPGCSWGGECLPTGAAIKTYNEGFVKIAKTIREAYPGRQILFEPINEPWGYGTAAQYAEIVAQLLPEAQKAGIPLNTIYVGSVGGAPGERSNKWITKMYEAKPGLEKEIQGWYMHPYGPPSGTEEQDSHGSGIESLPYQQKEMTSGQNNIIVSEVGYCTPDVNKSESVEKECKVAAGDGYGAENSTQAAKWLKEMLEHAKPYYEQGWLKALLVYSRGAGGYAMQLEGGALTKQGEALDGFADAQTGWTIQPTPSPGNLSDISCIWATDCTAVGSASGAVSAEAWNGASWSAQSIAAPSGVKVSSLNGVSCVSRSACTAVGSYNSSGTNVTLAESWNGVKWSVQSTPNPTGALSSSLLAVSCVSSTTCIGVGNYRNSGEHTVPLAEQLKGTTWTNQTISGPAEAIYSSLSDVSCTASNACTAVGYYEKSAGKEQTLAERWNGTSWAVQTTANVKEPEKESDHLTGVSCTSSTACVAVGGWQSKVTPETLAESWNGSEWKTQEAPLFGNGASLVSVSCTSATTCEAVGSQLAGKGLPLSLAENWGGTKWSSQTTPNPSAEKIELTAVSCPAIEACIAGGFSESSSVASTLVEADF